MYNEKILAQLNQLKYLQMVKKSNVNVMSKKNQYGDTIKFYAQINKDDIIQKISYKASGCTYFLVFGNYFCSLVEGKTIEDALKINATDLESLSELEASRKHVIDIILSTFALLIKKYRKGVESGKIIPAETVDKKLEMPKAKMEKTKTKSTTSKKVEVKVLEHKDKKNNESKKAKPNISSLVEKVNKIEKSKSKENDSNKISDKEISNINMMISKMEKSLKQNLTETQAKEQSKPNDKLFDLFANLETIRKNEKELAKNSDKTKKQKIVKTREEKIKEKELKKQAKKEKKAKSKK